METTPVAPSVLIFEPDPATAELYRRVLSRDYRVIICADEKQLLPLLSVHHLTAVVLVPAALGERSWDLVQQVKNCLPAFRVPIILCTTLDERKRGLEMGVAAYLVKPVLPNALIDALQRVTR